MDEIQVIVCDFHLVYECVKFDELRQTESLTVCLQIYSVVHSNMHFFRQWERSTHLVSLLRVRSRWKIAKKKISKWSSREIRTWNTSNTQHDIISIIIIIIIAYISVAPQFRAFSLNVLFLAIKSAVLSLLSLLQLFLLQVQSITT